MLSPWRYTWAVLLFFISLNLFPVIAHAGRVAFFEMRGRYSAKLDEIHNQQQASCIINITNPSSYSQTVTFKFDDRYPEEAATNNVDQAIGTEEETFTLAPNDNRTLIYEYSLILPNPSSSTTIDKQVVCKGWIFADDVSSTQRGFLVASGSLATFLQASRSSPVVCLEPPCTNGIKGITTHTQIPISIEDGRPF